MRASYAYAYSYSYSAVPLLTVFCRSCIRMSMSPLRLAPRAAVLVMAAVSAVSARGAAEAPRDLASLLQPLRDAHDMPALAGAVVQGGRVVALGAVGVRKRGADAAVTPADRFHIGSCTKSMTATLIATFVEESTLSWTTTVGDVFPDLKGTMHEGWSAVTLEQLLTHRAGAPATLDADGLWGRLWAHTGTPVEQRRTLVEGVTRRPPDPAPGTRYVYSNAGYAIAGAMLEKVAARPWEDLLRQRLFEPLGMASAGFGAPGTKGRLDQPLGHTAAGKPVELGPGADNPAAIGPGGTVHCTLADWARYAALHLPGGRGGGVQLAPETFDRLHAPVPGEGQAYAMGWIVCDRDWGGGRVLMHAGTNTMWYAVVWMAPKKDFAVLVAANQGGDAAAKACDLAAWAMIQDHRRKRE
jgi:CubicO group peptidase (beta-lactamase class C family)